MEPTVSKIFEDVNRLEELMSELYLRKKKNPTDIAKDQKELSDCLAFVVYEIRRKYELTSGLYCVSEHMAYERYRSEYGEE